MSKIFYIAAAPTTYTITSSALQVAWHALVKAASTPVGICLPYLVGTMSSICTGKGVMPQQHPSHMSEAFKAMTGVISQQLFS